MKKYLLNKPLVLINILLLSGFLSAQTFNLQNVPRENAEISLKFHKPFYSDESLSMSTFTGAYDLDFNIPLSRKFNLMASIPYIVTSYQIEDLSGLSDYEYNKSGIGNIYIGLQTRPEIPEDIRSTVSFGIFLPTADKEAASAGYLANYYNLQKYYPNSMGIYFNYAYHKLPKRGFHFGGEAGPNLVIPTKKELNTELFLHYGLNGGYKIDNFFFNVELMGIYIATGEAAEFGDRFVHLIDFGMQLSGDVISPKVFYEIYLKDGINDYIDGILGIGLTFSFE